MKETITLTTEEHRRALVLERLATGERTIAQAAVELGVSVRQAWRLKARYGAAGSVGLAHGNRGRASPRRIAPEVRGRVVELARSDAYRGANDCHLAELLAEREGLVLSRPSVRRILRGSGWRVRGGAAPRATAAAASGGPARACSSSSTAPATTGQGARTMAHPPRRHRRRDRGHRGRHVP